MTQKSHILIVEDRADWQDIVSSTVSAEGYLPNTVSSYDAAISALGQQEFALAVVDPVLDTDRRINRDGLTVIQKISELQPGTPMVIITGALTPDIQTSLQHLCPSAPIFLKESWDQADFITSIHKIMGESWELTSDPIVDLNDVQNTAINQSSLSKEKGYPRILLVENNSHWQQIVTNILDDLGCYWRTANTAANALELIESQSFQVAILDLKLQPNSLPLRSNQGWLLLDHFVETHPKIKVVVLSGKASAGDVAHLLTQYSPIRFIEKQNFTSQALYDALAQATQIPEIRIRSLGQFRVSRDGETLGVWDTHEAETALKLLLVRRARSEQIVPADELIARLWPDSDADEARRNLLPTINSARHFLEPDIEPRDSNFILRSANGYMFDLHDRIYWDLVEFRRYINEGKKLVKEEAWDEAKELLLKGRALYRGDFLAEERHIDWLNDMRRQITSDYCELLINLADCYAAVGYYSEAIESCELALRKDPLLESVYRRLMQYHYCLGQKSQSLKVFRDCIKLFEELFGESPAPATLQLKKMIDNDQSIDCVQSL
ncbi:BTAD domain-containing putative transcriptional regulator [Anaerolineales bacterium HSG24]|nr:BTAD domain-containing putative transcriptional regulator [Anaerolineales bacterium HSG24]